MMNETEITEIREDELEYVDVETIDIPMDDDTVVTCAILDDFEMDGKNYYAVAPIDENDVISDEIWIYNYEEDGDDLIINYIDDEEELRNAMMAFQDYLEEDGEDDEEGE